MRFRFAFKLGGAMAAPLAFVLVVAWVGVSSLSQVHGYVRQVAEDQMKVIDLVTQIQAEQGMYRQYELQHILSTTLGEMDDYKTRGESSAKAIRSMTGELASFATGDMAALVADLSKAWDRYEQTHAPLIDLSYNDKKGDALNLLRGESREALYEVEKCVRAMVSLAREECKGREAEALQVYERSRLAVLAVCALTVLIGILFTLILNGSIVRPLTDLAHASKLVASGDLTHELRVRKTRDESEEVSRSFAEMVSSLKGLIHDVSEGGEKVSVASGAVSREADGVSSVTERIMEAARTSVASANEQLASMHGATKIMVELEKAIEDIAEGAQEQSTAVADAVSAVKSMNSAVREMDHAAGEVVAAVERSRAVSDKGVSAVQRALGGLDSIKGKSKEATDSMMEFGKSLERITQILETIRQIADQTNLLALNAAIEAARAGEHGRGFAVVADEVRSLADRASKSTKEIADLIREVESHAGDAAKCVRSTFDEAASGRQMGDEVANALNEIVSVVADAGTRIEGIIQGMKTLSVHGDSVNRAAEKVAGVTERNSAATEEMSAASREVVNAVEQARSLAEKNSAMAEEMSSSVTQLKASALGLTKAAGSLTEIAETLRVSVGRFRTGAAGEAQADAGPGTPAGDPGLAVETV
ncbi:MAG: methyl-accepting chemotaxis protein [Ignavibacteriales bacterium]